jgi:diaminopimelate decarboxylase
MHHFDYRDGVMYAEDINLEALADDVGTPFYCYSSATLTRHFNILNKAFEGTDHTICYAMKANSNQAVLKTLTDLGAGLDVVSEGELRRALALKISGKRIVFSGVGKTAHEMALALREGVSCFNVESEPELELLSQVATHIGETATISLRINPDVDAGTHEKITTGKAENKFGVPYLKAEQVYAHAAKLPGIKIAGVDMHIGSQITDLEPFRKSYTLMAQLVERLRAAGHDISHVDLGGGLGVPYRGSNDIPPHPQEFADMVKETLGHLDCTIVMEPGRMIAGNAGILVTRIIHVKPGDEKNFVIVDAAMNDLIRPTLYEAYHHINPVNNASATSREMAVDIVGPVCETGDYLARGIKLPTPQSGDLLAVMTAGAYGAVQSGTYNTRQLIPEVMVNADKFAIIRPRQTFEELIGLDQLAGWQK